MPEVTITQAFELYRWDYIVFKNQSPKTEENHVVACHALVSFTGDIQLSELTFDKVRDWKLYLSKTRSEGTVRGYIIKLRVVLAYLKKRGYDCLDPEVIPVPKRHDTVVTYLTKEEVTRLIEASPTTRGKAIIALLYSSGIRISELIGLDRSQIIDGSFTIVGKGGKARLCFMDDRAMFYINKYLKMRKDNSPHLFISRCGTKGRLNAQNIQPMVSKAARIAGIQKKVTPHTLRHSFATDFTKNNGNMRHLQVLLGHSSLETTSHYAHVVNEDLRRAYALSHSI